jgi:hypothetical protein
MRNKVLLMALVVASAASHVELQRREHPSSPSALNPLSAPAGPTGRLRTFDDPTPMSVIISIVSSLDLARSIRIRRWRMSAIRSCLRTATCAASHRHGRWD